MLTDETDAPARRGVVICLFCREYINAETHPQDPGECREELLVADAAPTYQEPTRERDVE